MRIVFDTNVIISGFITTSGLSQHVFMLGIKRHRVVLSEYILEEIHRKLIHKLGIPAAEMEALNRFLRMRATVLKVKPNPEISFPDKKDIPILSLFEACNAHYFVTGDKALLGLKKFRQTLILSPREAAEVL